MKSDSQNKVASEQELLADDVAEYLKANPDFFVSQESLLSELTIPHESGKAISLLERQVILLREQNDELTRQIQEFINNANDNDTLFEKTRIVLLELLKCASLQELAQVLQKEITSKFAATECRMLFITDSDSGYDGLDCLPTKEAKQILGALFDKKRTFCGTLKPTQAQFLFAESADKIASTAIVPIHLSSDDKRSTGFNSVPVMVIGSATPNYFNNNQDTLFLDFIGEVLSALILHLRT